MDLQRVGPNGLVSVVSRELHHGQGIAEVRSSTGSLSLLQQGDVPSGTEMPCSASEARPSSEILSVVQGGSCIKSTSTQSTPSSSITFCLISSAIAGSAKQPINVGSNVMRTEVSCNSMFSISPRSVMLMGISGSGIVFKTSRISVLATTTNHQAAKGSVEKTSCSSQSDSLNSAPWLPRRPPTPETGATVAFNPASFVT